MNVYIIIPEVIEMSGTGTDLMTGDLGDVRVFQDKRDADHKAYQANSRLGPGHPFRYAVVEYEVE